MISGQGVLSINELNYIKQRIPYHLSKVTILII